VEYNKVIF